MFDYHSPVPYLLLCSFFFVYLDDIKQQMSPLSPVQVQVLAPPVFEAIDF